MKPQLNRELRKRGISLFLIQTIIFLKRCGEWWKKIPMKIKNKCWGKIIGGRTFGGRGRVRTPRGRQILELTIWCLPQLENHYEYLQETRNSKVRRWM